MLAGIVVGWETLWSELHVQDHCSKFVKMLLGLKARDWVRRGCSKRKWYLLANFAHHWCCCAVGAFSEALRSWSYFKKMSIMKLKGDHHFLSNFEFGLYFSDDFSG